MNSFIKSRFTLIFEIFLVFFKIGATTLGGGYVMFPIMQLEVVNKKKWITNKELIDFYAMGQSLPGLIGPNTAFFSGFRICGISGGIVAVLGVIIPSIMTISFIAFFMIKFNDYQIVKKIFLGVKAGVLAMVFNAVFNMWKNAVVDWITFIICIVSSIIVIFTDISPFFIIILSMIPGFFMRKDRDV